MGKSCIKSIFACIGAVIGAGFASGREIVSFFTRYGWHAWWLLLISSAVMALLCWLVLRRKAVSEEDWCSLFAAEPQWIQRTVRFCSVALMSLTGGAMVSAGGHMFALVWNHPQASVIGTAGTLAAAWGICAGKMSRLSWLSAALAGFFICISIVIRHFVPVSRTVRVDTLWTFPALLCAGVCAVGYAAMNMTLAIGVINRCRRKEKNACVSLGFGVLMLILLLVGNALFSRYPESQESDFPMVWLLRSMGKTGYLAGAALLYLAILTTLTSVLYAIRTALESMFGNKRIAAAGILGIPLAVSCIGFTGIVDSLYAPAGLACLLLVFAPLMRRSA